MTQRPRSTRDAARAPTACRPTSEVDRGKLDYARRRRDEAGLTLPEIVERAGLTRSTLFRHLPARQIDTYTAAGTGGLGDVEEIRLAKTAPLAAGQATWAADDKAILYSVTWPAG